MKHFGDPEESDKDMGIDMTPGVNPEIEPAPPRPPGPPGSGPPVNAVTFRRVQMERDALLNYLSPLPEEVRKKLLEISQMTDEEILASDG